MFKNILFLFLFVNLKTYGTNLKTEPPISEYSIDLYIRTLATENISYRTDLHILESNEVIIFGYHEDFSSIIGRFSYRPKHYKELTSFQKNELLNSKEFKQFSSDKILRFEINPSELISKGTLNISL